jgi:hypothetical protein
VVVAYGGLRSHDVGSDVGHHRGDRRTRALDRAGGVDQMRPGGVVQVQQWTHRRRPTGLLDLPGHLPGAVVEGVQVGVAPDRVVVTRLPLGQVASGVEGGAGVLGVPVGLVTSLRGLGEQRPGVRAGGVGPRPRRLGVEVVGTVGAGRLADPFEDAGDLPGVLVGARGQCAAVVGQPVLDRTEPLGAEDLLQQRVPLLGSAAQERLEPALGEQRDLAELRQRQPEQRPEQVAGLVDAAGALLPPAVGHLLDQDPGVLLDQTGSAPLGAHPLG